MEGISPYPSETPPNAPYRHFLQERQCLEGRARERFTDSGGLYLEVGAHGWQALALEVLLRRQGKAACNRLLSGRILAQARRARDDARLVLSAGSDPVQSKKDAKLAAAYALATPLKLCPFCCTATCLYLQELLAFAVGPIRMSHPIFQTRGGWYGFNA